MRIALLSNSEVIL